MKKIIRIEIWEDRDKELFDLLTSEDAKNAKELQKKIFYREIKKFGYKKTLRKLLNV